MAIQKFLEEGTNCEASSPAHTKHQRRQAAHQAVTAAPCACQGLGIRHHPGRSVPLRESCNDRAPHSGHFPWKPAQHGPCPQNHCCQSVMLNAELHQGRGERKHLVHPQQTKRIPNINFVLPIKHTYYGKFFMYAFLQSADQ